MRRAVPAHVPHTYTPAHLRNHESPSSQIEVDSVLGALLSARSCATHARSVLGFLELWHHLGDIESRDGQA